MRLRASTLAFLVLSSLAACAIPEPDRPIPPPEIRELAVVPFLVVPGAPAEIRWRVTGALDALELELPGQGAQPLGANEGALVIRPREDLVVRLRATGPGGTAQARAEARVGTPEPVRLERFTVTPTRARAGDPIRVAWSSRGATRVALYRGVVLVEDELSAAGARILRLQSSTELALRVEGLGGPFVRSHRVEIGEPPPLIALFEVDPPEVEANRQTTLRWSIGGAERLVLWRVPAEGEPSVLATDAEPESAGSLSLSERPGRYRYRLEVAGGGATRTATVTLLVREPARPRIEVFTTTPTITGRGGEALVEWSVRSADSVSLRIDDERPEVVAGVGARRLLVGEDLRLRLIAVGGGRTVSDALVLRLDPRYPVIRDFSATPPRSAPGEAVRLAWSVEEAAAVELEDELGRSLGRELDPESSLEIRPSGPLGVRLVARSSEGTTARTLLLEVGPRPVIERFEALDARYRLGRPLRYAYRVAGARELLLSTPGRPPVPLAPSTGVVALRRLGALPEDPDGRLEASSDLFSVSATAGATQLPPAGGVIETEPNEGTALAHVLARRPTFFDATLAPGDVDTLAVERLTPSRLRIEPRCTSGELALVVRATDDEGAPVAWSRRVDPLPCGGVVEAELADLPAALLLELEGDNPRPVEYLLDLTEVRPACGDGVVDRNEACDDGNRAGGDGCDDRCQAEGLDEVEPNDASATASPLAAGVNEAFLGLEDEDWHQLLVDSTRAGRWSFVLESPGGRCDLDARLSLVDPAGVEVGRAGADGLGCPTLEGAATVLGPGRWHLRVEPGDGRTRPARGFYRLSASPPP